MAEELAVAETTDLTTLSAADSIAMLKSQKSKYNTPETVAQVTTSNEFLPFIQLMGGSSKLCKEGKFPVGNYALMKGKNPTNLGDSFICLIVGWRSKAMQFAPVTKSFYDRESEGFKKIQEGAVGQNSNKGFGPEFLLWLPELETFAYFFMGNASGRSESPNLINCQDKGSSICKMTLEFVTSKKTGNSWHAPRFNNYDLSIKMPEMKLTMKLLEKFNNPKAEEEDKEASGESRG